jgi:hypothetical protein
MITHTIHKLWISLCHGLPANCIDVQLMAELPRSMCHNVTWWHSRMLPALVATCTLWAYSATIQNYLVRTALPKCQRKRFYQPTNRLKWAEIRLRTAMQSTCTLSVVILWPETLLICRIEHRDTLHIYTPTATTHPTFPRPNPPALPPYSLITTLTYINQSTEDPYRRNKA